MTSLTCNCKPYRRGGREVGNIHLHNTCKAPGLARAHAPPTCKHRLHNYLLTTSNYCLVYIGVRVEDSWSKHACGWHATPPACYICRGGAAYIRPHPTACRVSGIAQSLLEASVNDALASFTVCSVFAINSMIPLASRVWGVWPSSGNIYENLPTYFHRPLRTYITPYVCFPYLEISFCGSMPAQHRAATRLLLALLRRHARSDARSSAVT